MYRFATEISAQRAGKISLHLTLEPGFLCALSDKSKAKIHKSVPNQDIFHLTRYFRSLAAHISVLYRTKVSNIEQSGSLAWG
jgi:hypothetical protein